MIPASGWPDAPWRDALLHWLALRVRDAATVDDLAQETLLLTAVSANRRGMRRKIELEKLGFGIARNLLAREFRRRAKGPRSSREIEALHCPETPEGTGSEPDATTREHLASIRERLEPTLGPTQRLLVAAIVDTQITSVRELSRRLDTAPANVRRMLAAIAYRVTLLG